MGLTALLMLSSCYTTEPPWTDEDGAILSASQVIEYRGFARCGTQSVIFFRFFDRQYANDPQGVLGPLISVDGSGRELTFEVVQSMPPGALGTGVRRGEREVFVDQSSIEDYLYIEYPTYVERWPRAEVYCRA